MNTLKKRTIITLSALILLAAALGLWALQPRLGDGLPMVFSWKAGHRYLYALEYTSDDRVELMPQQPGASAAPAGASFHGSFALKGALVLKAYGWQGGAHLLGLRLTDLTRHAFSAMGQDLLPSKAVAQATFNGQEALLKVDPRGQILSLHFAPESAPLFRQTVSALLGESIVELVRQKPSWQVSEVNHRGESRASYTLVGARGGRYTIDKEKRRYHKLSALMASPAGLTQHTAAEAQVVLDARGHLDSFSGREKIAVYTPAGEVLLEVAATTRLRLTGIEAFDYSAAQGLAALGRQLGRQLTYRMGQPIESTAAKTQLLNKISNGLTIDSLAEQLRLLTDGGELPRDFNWRATALLELQPELCEELLQLFEEPTLSSRARVAIQSLLAGTGHREAQAVMRQLITSDVARRDASYPQLISQFSFVAAPETQTLELLQQRSLQERASSQVAAVYALGAAVGNAFRRGDPSAALSANQALVSRLEGAGDPLLQRQLLVALGNAGIEDNIATIERYSEAPQAALRSEAVYALRKNQTPVSEGLVLRRLADTDFEVQRSAINTLGQYALRTEHLEAIDRNIRQGAVAELSYLDLLPLLGRAAQTKPHTPLVREIMQAMLAGGLRQAKIRELIEAALGRLS